VQRLSSTAAAIVAAGLAPLAAGDSWPLFARTPDRLAMADGSIGLLASVRWLRADDGNGNPIAFIGQAGVVTDGSHVYAVGRVNSAYRLFAIRISDGGIEWSQPVPAPYADSWSTPACDPPNGTVLVAAGRMLSAFDAATGAPRWQAPLARSVVNASPLVTTDRGPADRAFITDYDGLGGDASLYCINLDPLSASNPFQPGQVLWSVPIGGSSGSTPAYSGGTVFVASVTDETGLGPGRILAFDAGATAAPAPLWIADNPTGLPFFGGVSVSGGAVYAASYAFAGGQTAANLIKLDAATGALLWSTPCNRTDSTPIPLGDGRIVLCGGVIGFGSAPSIQLLHDDGASATMLWDTALDTWQDLNHNALMDPGEYLLVGGWTHLPLFAAGRLYAGAIDAGTTTFGPCTDLYALDLSRTPSQPGFIAEHVAGLGSTPAVAGGSLYTVGAAGLYALAGCYANCDGSTQAPLLNVNDFVCFQSRFASADPWANCDGSTQPPILNVNDFVCFQSRFAGGCP
jgi:outer membrane protein assembly factor BamB